MVKAEVWGRLSYCGMNVIAELAADDEIFLIAQRVAPPVEGRKTSYYAIVPLERVGLDGGVIYAHKIRTMYPFSEFLKKRIFDEHGLDATGKFSNGFRLTEKGKFLRTIRQVLKESTLGIVTILPSKNYIESLPVKMFEYMSAGLPVIASNFPL